MANRKRFPYSTHRGSSLVFLGLSTLAFIITYGIVWYFTPMILGAVDSEITQVMATMNISAEWLATYDSTQSTLQWLIPVAAAVGIMLIVLKVLMVASVRGAD